MRHRIRLVMSGAVVAFAAATALFNGAPGAIATQGQPVLAGQTNSESGTTVAQFSCSAVGCYDFPALEGDNVSSATNHEPIGVLGYAGASSPTKLEPAEATGVLGTSGAGNGVEGDGTVHGVVGDTSSSDGSGVYGTNTAGGDAIQGVTAGTQASAVYGHNTSGGGSVAKAIFGSATGGGTGVRGESASGHGVEGVSFTGTGVYASGPRALQVVGKATFSRSGLTTIAAGTSSKAISLGGVTTASMVLATSQQNSTVFVRSVVPASGSFTIRLSGVAPSGGLKVAYFVLN